MCMVKPPGRKPLMNKEGLVPCYNTDQHPLTSIHFGYAFTIPIYTWQYFATPPWASSPLGHWVDLAMHINDFSTLLCSAMLPAFPYHQVGSCKWLMFLPCCALQLSIAWPMHFCRVSINMQLSVSCSVMIADIMTNEQAILNAPAVHYSAGCKSSHQRLVLTSITSFTLFTSWSTLVRFTLLSYG